MRRATTTGQVSGRYSRSICPIFVGATLCGRPSMGNFSQIEVYRHAHAHPMDVLFFIAADVPTLYLFFHQCGFDPLSISEVNLNC